MTIIVYPEYISLKDWAANLVIDYPGEYLPVLANEDKWQEWGASVVSSGIFAKLEVPSPYSISQGRKTDAFPNWQEWAKVMYRILIDEKPTRV